MCLLIFCLGALSIGLRGVLKSLTIIVLLLISPFMAVRIYLMYWGTSMLGEKYLQLLYLLIGLIPYHHVVSPISFFSLYLKFIWSDTSIATLAFLWFPLVCNIFFHPLTFSPYMCLALKWVSRRQGVYRSCFCIHSASLWSLGWSI